MCVCVCVCVGVCVCVCVCLWKSLSMEKGALNNIFMEQNAQLIRNFKKFYYLTLSLRRHLNNAQSCYTEHHKYDVFLARNHF